LRDTTGICVSSLAKPNTELDFIAGSPTKYKGLVPR